jgi:hypothetical protein
MKSPIQPVVDLLTNHRIEHRAINEQLVGFEVKLPTNHKLYQRLAAEGLEVPARLEAVFCRYTENADAPGLLILDCLVPVEFTPQIEVSVVRYLNALNERLVWPYLILRSDELLISCRLSSYIVQASDLGPVILEMISALSGGVLLFFSSIHKLTESTESVETALQHLHELMLELNEPNETP